MEPTMQTRLPRLLLTLTLLAALTQTRAAVQTPARRAAAGGGDTVVFAVSKSEAGVTMEPVVIYRRGTFVKPPIEDSEAAANAFVKEYFRAGRQYRLLSGGGEAGTVTVVKYAEQGCTGLNAEVTAQTSARLGGQVQALAVSSATIGRQTGSRRAPTDAERASALTLARAAYTKNGLGAALVKKMEVGNLTATDLDGDGNFELVGSFQIENNTGQAENSYTLFMIFEPEGGGFKPALTWFHRGGEGDSAARGLVDQVDLDGDGVAEVVVGGIYYESNDYVIYKKRQGRWVSVYQGGGGGC
ncbi:MAG: hypothetical protein DMF66_12155 [Acidobacteria bacterium]|nr:MAG: hypothetical protein DMF66_12155 [Acidobacteriota bacterium]